MKTILSWSTGKDSAWALHILRQRRGVELAGLVTTVNSAFDRVAMHGVRHALARLQAKAAGLELHAIDLPYPCPNEAYEECMSAFVGRMRKDGVDAIALGDLFLEDIRAYREARMAGTGIAPVFPVWGQDTRRLAHEMIDAGLKARLVCIDPRHMPREMIGAEFDRHLLDALPATVDPCGEKGEFHTFAYAGPMFSAPIPIRPGETVERDGFLFQDVLPETAEPQRVRRIE